MNGVEKIKKASKRKYGPVMVFLIALLMLGSVFVNANISENNQGSPDEGLCYFEIGEDTIGVTIPVGSYEIINTDQGDEISVEDFGRLLVPGKPNLPSKIFAVAIPPPPCQS